MTFTTATTNALAKYAKIVDYKLELRTNFAGSDTWQEYPFADFRLVHDMRGPAMLYVTLANDELAFSEEQSTTNRTQLLAQVRLGCTVGSESELLFQGRVYRIVPQDYGFELVAQDWLSLIHECECEVSLAPDETDEITPARQLFLVGGGAFGSTYGFAYAGAGDPAFNQDANPGTRRRSWAASDIRLWYDSAATDEVAPRHYQINLTSGTASILEQTGGKTYYATGVHCYVEGSLDWAAVFRAALEQPRSEGGIGATAGELDCPDTGLDVAGAVYFSGRVSDLLKQILRRQQANLRLWYDSRQGKFKLRVVTQKAETSADWELQHARTIAQPRDLRELYSRVVVCGYVERPPNALTAETTTVSAINEGGSWLDWFKLNGGPGASFSVVKGYLWDGDAGHGAGVTALPGTQQQKYHEWHPFIKIDLGSVQRVTRIRATVPSSANPNSTLGSAQDSIHFWPGLRVLGSVDDEDYRLMAVQLCGRFRPLSQVEAREKEILYPKVRYLKVLCGAYKQGVSNHHDPAMGLMEFEVYTAEEYRIVKEIDGNAEPATYYDYTADYDKDGAIDRWQRNQPDLYARLGGRHRTRFDEQYGALNEFLAHDRALDLLAESVRLFQQVTYDAVCDPRVELYDTVFVRDALNGDVGAILAECVVLTPSGTQICGTNYGAPALGNG